MLVWPEGNEWKSPSSVKGSKPVKPVWSSSFGRPRPTMTLMTLAAIPDRATEVKMKKNAEASQLDMAAGRRPGKHVLSCKKQQDAKDTGRNERPFAVADFRHRAEEHEHMRFGILHQIVNDTIQMAQEDMAGQEQQAPDRIPGQRGRSAENRLRIATLSLPARGKEAEELTSDTDQRQRILGKVIGRLHFSDDTGTTSDSFLLNN